MCSCCSKTALWVVIALILTGLFIFLIINLASPAVLGGTQAELNSAEGDILPNGDNVVFNTVLNNQSSDIIYNPVTGEFTITAPGNYLVSWWFATDGAGPAINVSFAVDVNGVPYSIASSPIVSGQLSGDALVTVTTTPTVVTLVNVTGEDVFIPTTPVQANIVITQVVD